VRDDLVAKEIKVDPMLATAPFGAGEKFAIESARGGEVMDGEGEVEWGHEIFLGHNFNQG
jgi:hypothetical protein